MKTVMQVNWNLVYALISIISKLVLFAGTSLLKKKNTKIVVAATELYGRFLKLWCLCVKVEYTPGKPEMIIKLR